MDTLGHRELTGDLTHSLSSWGPGSNETRCRARVSDRSEQQMMAGRALGWAAAGTKALGPGADGGWH